jgi:dolichol-phosphate mannosyltransferase
VSRTLVVLPTYNEAGNLERLVRAVLEQDVRVLVVDDNSPDGTGAIADRLAAELDGIEVLHRPRKAGLGRAYVAGFEHALRSDAELIVEMDADFSHDPADLPRLVAAADDADLVLGSRYVDGGGVVDWGLFRRALSRGGSLYARLMLGVPVRDLTGGFKCFRRELLEAIAPAEVLANGYAFQIELTYRAVRAGFRVLELPIVFRDRAVGRSKMTPAIAVEAVWRVLALRARRHAILFEATEDQP